MLLHQAEWDRGGGRRGCGGSHPGRAHKGGGQADTAAVFHREYGAVDMPDCEEESEKRAEEVEGKSCICISIEILIEHCLKREANWDS
jgi:hypothetical protein